ncbi:hypothetical protein PYCC9005_000190 [Savitreella phatthalungensis]
MSTQQSQNDGRLDDLASKISALRGVTNDIYAQASDYSLIDANRERFSKFSDDIRKTAGRLGRVASSGGFKQQMKMALAIVAVVIGLWFLYGLFT